ncbi:MAG: type I DNA topoisomerase [bacterium]
MAKHLLIVESPAKAKSINKYLGKDYKVEASYGHFKDLPKKELGVNVKNNFEPTYVIDPSKKTMLNKLKNIAKNVDNILLAPDPDREGEAIAWHLQNELQKINTNISRVTFNEITKVAVKEAVLKPSELDMDKVDAQQARRILDRLVGYKVSPLLWKKIKSGLSAGRVQSVALRLVVEREIERKRFDPQEYWSVTAILNKDNNNNNIIEAKLYQKGNKKIGKNKNRIKNEQEANKVVNELQDKKFIVQSIKSKVKKRYPYPPFTTSALQQEASSKINFQPKKTMYLAQQLYEGIEVEGESQGLITYMRTDSTRISEKGIEMARKYLKDNYKDEYIPGKAKNYKTKGEAQDAHEAIRPTDVFLTPTRIKKYLTNDQYKLYNLIWKRFIACQMNPARFNTVKVRIKADEYLFKANGSQIAFNGFIEVYDYIDKKDKILPNFNEEEELKLNKLEPKQHYTKPPRRYTEATLIKDLEEKGIGRPSTYASILTNIENKSYVEKEDKYLKSTELGEIVTEHLIKQFPDIFNVSFTSEMEDSLDSISNGKLPWKNMLGDFYDKFEPALQKAQKEMDSITPYPKSGKKCNECDGDMLIKNGKYGKFLACSNYPTCKNTMPYDKNKKNKSKPKQTDKKCPKCDSPLVIRNGKYGEFYGCSGYPKCKYVKNIKKKVGTCPKCGGDMIERKTKKGKTFFGCSTYPDCKHAIWDKSELKQPIS